MPERRRSARLDREPGRALVNLALVGRRLAHRRPPAASAFGAPRLWLAGFAAAAGAIALLALVADAASVGWAEGLPAGVRSVFAAITDIGLSQWFLVPSGVLVVVLLLGRWSGVSARLRVAWAEVGFLAAYVFLAVGGGALLVNLIKQVVGRGRPVGFGENGRFAFDPFNFDYANASFPSGHSTTAGAILMAGCLIFPRWRVPFIVAGVAIGLSRVVVGAHFPSDVLAGLLLGAAWAWLLARLFATRAIGFRLGPDGRLRAARATIRRAGRSRGWRAFALAPLQALAGPREPLN